MSTTTKKIDNQVTEPEVKTPEVKNPEVKKPEKWMVSVDCNPAYCGIGAGGVQFANGKAVIESARMAAWFREHDGYTVTEQ